MTGKEEAIESLYPVHVVSVTTGKGAVKMAKGKRLLDRLTTEEVLTLDNMIGAHIKQDITGPMLSGTGAKFKRELQRRKDKLDETHKRKD